MTDTTATSPYMSKQLVAIGAFSVSSVAMMVGNKLAVTHFPLPACLVVIQTIATLLFLLPNREQIAPLEITKVKLWLPVASLFAFMLFSSLKSLTYANISTVLIFRNGGNVVNCCAEYYFLNKGVSPGIIGALIGTLLGATMYGLSSASATPIGVFWIFLNVCGQVTYGIYVKYLMDRANIDLTKFGMSFYNNTLALPIFLVIALWTGEFTTPAKNIHTVLQGITYWGWTMVFITCIAGYCISVAGFQLQKVVSATTFMVVNNLNKFACILFGVVFLGDQFKGFLPTIGCCFAIGCGGWYAWEQMKLQQEIEKEKLRRSTQSQSFTAEPDEEKGQR